MRDFSFFGDYIYIKGTMAKVIANTKVIPKRGGCRNQRNGNPKMTTIVLTEVFS